VIVGGGAFGLAVARSIILKLDTNRFRLIVITPRPFYVHLPALIRTSVTSTGDLEKEALMPYGESLGDKGEYKIGTVASIVVNKESKNSGEVVLGSGERVSFSALVLTPGSVWEGPLAIPESEADIKQHFNSWREKIGAAKSIVLVGGGAVGIEFAGELKDFYPDKRVVLVHGQDALLNEAYPDRFRAKAYHRLKQTGTEIILQDHVDTQEPSADGIVTTRSGKSIQADLVIQTRGPRPNTQFIAESLGSLTVTPSGHVKVSSALQLPGFPNIFAGGDVIDWKEQKQMFKTAGHAAVIAKNVLNIIDSNGADAVYKGSPEMIVTTIGREAGVAYFGLLWGLVFGDWVAKTIKSKGLVIEMTRGNYGLGRI